MIEKYNLFSQLITPPQLPTVYIIPYIGTIGTSYLIYWKPGATGSKYIGNWKLREGTLIFQVDI